MAVGFRLLHPRKADDDAMPHDSDIGRVGRQEFVDELDERGLARNVLCGESVAAGVGDGNHVCSLRSLLYT